MIITKQEYLNLISTSEYSQKEKDENISNSDKQAKNVLILAKSAFNLIIESGEKDAIIWDDVKYKSCKPSPFRSPTATPPPL